MNCRRVHEIWDEYRDGTLEASEARSLEDHLADCGDCERVWRRESSLLTILGEKSPVGSEADARAFTASVVRAWSQPRQQNIVWRIARLSAAAAVIALMLTVATVMVDRNSPDIGPQLTDSRVTPIPVMDTPRELDSVGVLVASIDGPATAVRQAFHSNASLINVDSYLDGFVRLLDDAAATPKRR